MMAHMGTAKECCPKNAFSNYSKKLSTKIAKAQALARLPHHAARIPPKRPPQIIHPAVID